MTVYKAESSPVLYNTPELVTRVTDVFRGVFGEANVVERKPVMAGEDFGRFGREEPRIPVFMSWLGAVPPDRMAASQRPGAAPLPGLHSSKFLPEPAATLRTGVVAMTTDVSRASSHIPGKRRFHAAARFCSTGWKPVLRGDTVTAYPWPSPTTSRCSSPA